MEGQQLLLHFFLRKRDSIRAERSGLFLGKCEVRLVLEGSQFQAAGNWKDKRACPSNPVITLMTSTSGPCGLTASRSVVQLSLGTSCGHYLWTAGTSNEETAGGIANVLLIQSFQLGGIAPEFWGSDRSEGLLHFGVR
jgi:hypothetical protein